MTSRKKHFALPIETMLRDDEKLTFSRRAFNRAMVEPVPEAGGKDQTALFLLPTDLAFREHQVCMYYTACFAAC